MKVVLVYPDIIKRANWQGYYYTGIGYLAGALLAANHDVELLHITREISEDEFTAALRAKLGPADKQLVAFSSTTGMFSFVQQWSDWTKKAATIFTIAGGVHPTLNPEQVINQPYLDAICVGEGEATLVDLANALEQDENYSGIKNLWLKTESGIVRNEVRPLLANLDTLPFPNRSLFDYSKLELEARGTGVFMASRGCPYRCTYCCNDALMTANKTNRRDYVRFRSVPNIIEEIQTVVSQFPFIKTIHFDDDILPLRPEWFEKFALVYRKNIGLPFECNLRPNLVNQQVTMLLKEAGCREVRLGIESGNDDIRNKILNRGLDRKRLVNAATMLKDAGISVYSFNMVGLPFETARARLETVKLNAEIDFDNLQVSIFQPFAPTRLYEICEEQDILTGRQMTDVHHDTPLKMSAAARQQVIFTAYFFPLLVRGYGLLMRLPKGLRIATIKVSDSILSSRITALTVFPALIGMYRTIRKQKWLERMVRKTSRRLLFRSETKT